MPPKINQIKHLIHKASKLMKVEKQTKLFSKEIIEQPKQSVKLKKSKSKQFSELSTIENNSQSQLWEYGSGITPSKLLISAWNVNGIRAVLGRKQLEVFVDKTKPDIFCLSQTKIDYDAFQKNPIKIPGYYGYWNFCKCSAGYSGVAIFSKYLPINAQQDLKQPQHSQQGRILTVQFQKFYLVTAYIPNSGQGLDRLNYRVEQYDKSFQNHCNNLKIIKPVIICGDLNVGHEQIDVFNAKNCSKFAGFTKQERLSFNNFLDQGWIDTFRYLYPDQIKYSWWSMRTKGRSKNQGWRIDYFLVNSSAISIVKDSRINNQIMGSDHCPVELIVELE